MKSILLALFASAAMAFAADNIPPGYQLVFEENFETRDALQRFTFTDPEAWKISLDEKEGALELVKQSAYKPEVRSPVNLALIKDKIVGDFILEADMLQTGREYGHRDMCVFFGFQNPKQFYYVHMATKADPNAHNVFIVNNAPRKNIAKKTTKGVDWGLEVWHKIRVERTLADGAIKVYFDNMTAPIMIARDKTFGAGLVGFGSFDDTGKIANIKLWAPAVEQRETPVRFPSPN